MSAVVVKLPFDRRDLRVPLPFPSADRDTLQRARARFQAYRLRHAARSLAQLVRVLEERQGRLLPDGLPSSLTDLLLEENLVSTAELRDVFSRLGRLEADPDFGLDLVASGLVTASALRHIQAQRLGIPCVDLDACPPDPALSLVLPANQMHRRRVLPLCRHGLRTVVVVADVHDRAAIALARRASASGIELCVAPDGEITDAIDRLLGEDITRPGF